MMTTLWDRELGAERELIDGLPPERRTRLVLSVVEDTMEALPAPDKALLASNGKTVKKAMDILRGYTRGVPVDLDKAVKVVDRLMDLSDDVKYVQLWQLFNALTYCVAMKPSGVGSETTRETLAACYDVIRDCQNLPEDLPAEETLALEAGNAACRDAIQRQRRLVGEAASG